MIPHILMQHVEEVSFQWMMRDYSVYESLHSLQELADLDTRVAANLDGVRFAGDDGWQFCVDELQWQEPGEVFAAAIIALENNNPEQVDEVLKIASTNLELSRGLVSAIGWIDESKAKDAIRTLMASEDPSVQRIGLAAAAIRRFNLRKPLIQAIESEDLDLKKRALQAAGELGSLEALKYVQAHFADDDPQVRFFSLISARLLGDQEASSKLLELSAELEGWQAESAVATAFRGSSLQNASGQLKSLVEENQDRRLHAIGVGAIGDPAHVEWLLKLMADDDLARIAGESFSLITGIDLAYENLERDEPEGFDAGPTEDAEDDNVEMDVDQALPWPDPQLIGQWWRQNKSNFSSGKRYLLGKPIGSHSLREALTEGKQQQRTAAAVEYCVDRPDSALFETRMPGYRQQAILNAHAKANA